MDLLIESDEEELEVLAAPAPAAPPAADDKAAPAPVRAAPPAAPAPPQPPVMHALPLTQAERGVAASAAPRAFTSGKPAAPAPPASKAAEVQVERFSGLRIKSRVLPSLVVDERLRDLRVLKLPRVRDDLQGDWAVVAVLSDKSSTKETSQGKKYGVWTLSDLDGNELRLFVFGDAFAEHWKESESAVLAVLSAQVRAAEGGGLSLSVDKPGQLFKLATSADFGLCRGERKDGRRCTMALNVRLCEYCPFHASAALKSLRSGRLELSTGGNLAFSLRRQQALAGRGRGRGPAAYALPMRTAAPPARSGAQAPRAAPEPSRFLTPGSRQLQGVAGRLQPAAAAAARAGGPLRAPAQPPPRAQELLRMHGSTARPVVAPAPAARPAPPHFRAAPRGPVMQLEDDDPFAEDEARAAAAALSRQRGGFQAPDPSRPASVRPRPPPAAAPAPAPAAAPLRPLAPAAAPPQRARAAMGEAPAKRSFGAAFAAVTSSAAAAAAEAAPPNARLAAAAAAEAEEELLRTLDALGKREGLVDAAAKLTRLDVQAWRCGCGALTEAPLMDCLEAGHGGRRVSVVKRLFACRRCKRRASTLDSRFVSRNCAGCGGNDFDRAPLRSGPALNVHDGVACREALLPRGEEHAFSLRQLR